MAGHMGNVKKTLQNLEVIEIDTERNLIFIKGSIAGHDNSFVVITPSIKNKQIEREIFKVQETKETPEVEAQAEEKS
jgi:ribosomal protein L3